MRIRDRITLLRIASHFRRISIWYIHLNNAVRDLLTRLIHRKFIERCFPFPGFIKNLLTVCIFDLLTALKLFHQLDCDCLRTLAILVIRISPCLYNTYIRCFWRLRYLFIRNIYRIARAVNVLGRIRCFTNCKFISSIIQFITGRCCNLL